MFVQDGVGGRTLTSVPASVKNGGLINGLLDSTPNSQTMIKFVTLDNGVTFHAVLVDLATGATTIVPQGNDLNDHLEWNGLSWDAQQFFEFKDVGPHADDGFNRFPNDEIALAWRNQANTGNVELKVIPFPNYLDLTNSANETVGMQIRTQDNNILTLAQTPTAGGIAFISTTSTQMWFEIGAFQKIRLIGQEVIQFFDNIDNNALFRTINGINLGALNALIFEFFGADSSFTGKAISRFNEGLHYDLEDPAMIHSFRIGGGGLTNAVDITALELLIYSPLDIVPTSDGLQDIGVASNSFNDLNIDRIIFRHNNGISSTDASIGRTSRQLRLNSPVGKAIEFDIAGVEEVFIDNFGLHIKNLNSIFFLDNSDNQDVIISTFGGASLTIKNNTTTGALIVDTEATIPSFILRGNNSADGLLAHEIIFQGFSDTNVIRDYASIKVEMLNTQFGNETTNMRFALQESGTFDIAYLALNSLFREVHVFKNINMFGNDVLRMGGGTISELPEDLTPDAATDFIMTFDASQQVLKKVLINNLPFSGGDGGDGAGLFAQVVKKVDDLVNNSTVFVLDSELNFFAIANKVYFIELNSNFESPSASDIKFGLKIPPGASYKIADANEGTDRASGSLGSGWTPFTFITNGETISYEGQSGTRQSNHYLLVEAGPTGGTVTITFAQVSAQATDTKLLRGSLMRVFEEGRGGTSPVPGGDTMTALTFFVEPPTRFLATFADPRIFAEFEFTWNIGSGTPRIAISAGNILVSGEIRTVPISFTTTAVALGSLVLIGGNITNGGSGYTPSGTFPCTVTGGGGSGASISARADTGGTIVFFVSVVNGSGFTSVPIITIPPPGGPGFQATGTATMGVGDLSISDPGTGYNFSPDVTFSGGGGSGANGQATINSGGNIVAYDRGSFGTGYTSRPNAIFANATDPNDFVEVGVAIVGNDAGGFNDFQIIASNITTFQNLLDNFTQNFAWPFLNTNNKASIVYYGRSSDKDKTRQGELRNMYWTFNTTVPSFVTVVRKI